MPRARQIAKAISTTEAAIRFHVTRNYIARLARQGAIKADKFGRDWLIDEVSLQSYLATPQKRGPKPGSTHKAR